MADGPAPALNGDRPRTFPHLRPLSDAAYAEQHADAVWHDVCAIDYGRAELRRHRKVLGRPSWRFPYYDRVYVAHRYYRATTEPRSLEEGGVWDVTQDPGWAVSLWLAPWAEVSLGLPRDAASAPTIHLEADGPLLTGQPTLREAVRGLALKLLGTLCDHGCTRGRDTCSGCDVLDDMYNDLP